MSTNSNIVRLIRKRRNAEDRQDRYSYRVFGLRQLYVFRCSIVIRFSYEFESNVSLHTKSEYDKSLCYKLSIIIKF